MGILIKTNKKPEVGKGNNKNSIYHILNESITLNKKLYKNIRESDTKIRNKNH